MATFTRGGVTYPSQYAYRQALARRRGYDSKTEQEKAQKSARTDPTFRGLLAAIPPADRSKMTAILWHSKGVLGQHVEGKPKKIPPDLADLIDQMEDQLGDRPHLIWRWLYA